jgi:hypothetical protein
MRVTSQTLAYAFISQTPDSQALLPLHCTSVSHSTQLLLAQILYTLSRTRRNTRARISFIYARGETDMVFLNDVMQSAGELHHHLAADETLI